MLNAEVDTSVGDAHTASVGPVGQRGLAESRGGDRDHLAAVRVHDDQARSREHDVIAVRRPGRCLPKAVRQPADCRAILNSLLVSSAR